MKIAYHSNRKSIIELLPKLTQFDGYYTIMGTKKDEFEETRKELLLLLVQKLESSSFEV